MTWKKKLNGHYSEVTFFRIQKTLKNLGIIT